MGSPLETYINTRCLPSLDRLAYRAGVTSGIVAPANGGGFLSGLSVKFSTNALHKLEPGAVIKDVVALHVSIGKGAQVSTSTQIALLRRLLDGEVKGEVGDWFKQVRKVRDRVLDPFHSCLSDTTLRTGKGQTRGRRRERRHHGDSAPPQGRCRTQDLH